MDQVSTTVADVLALLQRGEDLDVEFKSDVAKVSDAHLIEAAVCLANGRGGTLLLGVEDDGRVTGLHPARPAGGVGVLEAVVANNTVPPLGVQATRVHLEPHDVVWLRVPRAESPVGTSQGLYKRRGRGPDGRPACMPYLQHEMLSRAASFRDLDHSAMEVMGATTDDLDPVEIARLRRAIEVNADRSDVGLRSHSDLDLLKALGLVSGSETITNVRLAGLLLVGKEASLARLVPTHEVAFQVMAGTRPEVNAFTRAPLIRCAEEIETRFAARNRATEVDVGFRRIPVPDVSPTGFREAFLNALLHRDYARRGTVTVQWRADELEITSPGGFVEGLHAQALLTAGAQPRNQALASAMHRIGLAERLGRGINAIFEGQLRFGRPAPDYSRSGETSVRVVLPGGQANLEFTRFVLEREADGTRPSLSVDELLALHVVQRERRVSAEDAAIVLQRQGSGARRVLEGLVERGILAAMGEGQRRRYVLSPATFTALGQAADGIRARGFMNVQHREMVLAYTFEHGRIVRSQVATLCQIDSEAAKQTLQDLLASESLVLHGLKRGAFYTLAAAELERLSKTVGRISKRRAIRRTRNA